MDRMSQRVPVEGDLDRAYRSLLRRTGLAASLLLGLTAVVEITETRHGPAAQGFDWMFLFSATAAVTSVGSTWGPLHRGTRGPAQQGEGCVHLPPRRLRSVLLCTCVASVTAWAVGMPFQPDAPRRAAGVAVLLVGFLLWEVPRRARHDPRLRLDQHGLVWRDLNAKEQRLGWDDVRSLAPDRRVGGLLVGLEGDRRASVPLSRSAWTASAVGEVVRHYAETPTARAELTDAASLEKFRTDT